MTCLLMLCNTLFLSFLSSAFFRFIQRVLAQSDMKKISLTFDIACHIVLDDIQITVMALRSQLALMNINEGL